MRKTTLGDLQKSFLSVARVVIRVMYSDSGVTALSSYARFKCPNQPKTTGHSQSRQQQQRPLATLLKRMPGATPHEKAAGWFP